MLNICFVILVDPALFREFSESLMDLLSRSPPLAFSQVVAGSPQGESVQAIINHANTVVSQSSGGRVLHLFLKHLIFFW